MNPITSGYVWLKTGLFRGVPLQREERIKLNIALDHPSSPKETLSEWKTVERLRPLGK